ncbi:MAG: HisA/HisF-related TIM barrel protein, partial [Kangiellaceae bacterium]
MRVGSTVLLKEQLCVQSYGWNMMRPLGSLQGVLDSLEEYQCDEVAIIRPVRKNDTLSLFGQDLQILRKIKTMTPISFGGGIRTIEQLKLLKGLPIERVIFSSAFLEKKNELVTLAKDLFGHQAIKCLLPIGYHDGTVCVYHSSEEKYLPLSSVDTQFIDELANEVILFDMFHEGSRDQFDWSILSEIPFATDKLI